MYRRYVVPLCGTLALFTHVAVAGAQEPPPTVVQLERVAPLGTPVCAMRVAHARAPDGMPTYRPPGGVTYHIRRVAPRCTPVDVADGRPLPLRRFEGGDGGTRILPRLPTVPPRAGPAPDSLATPPPDDP